MATPKPGEIRCPTCHRSTPPAAFCTQCGSAIPADARIRPRGMDRDELQDRIRARRSGGDPYRRGSESEEGTGIYERFEPDPTDAMARQSRPPDEQRRDLFDERAAAAAALPPSPAAPADPPRSLVRDPDEWTAPAPTPPSAAPEPEWGEPAPPPPDAPVDNFDEVAYGDAGYEPAYDYEAWEEPQRSSNSLLPILGFLGLGVLALVAGAVIANMMGSSGIGASSPSPTVSVAPSVEATTVPTAVPSDSAAPSGSPGASGGPIVFPDGFTAEAQPCLPGSAGGSGCDSNGVSNGGSVDIWVGFENGNRNDVVGAILEAPDGSIVDDATIDLARIGCGQSCNGWTRFSFANLPPGTYEVRITRNGEPASSTTFEVS